MYQHSKCRMRQDRGCFSCSRDCKLSEVSSSELMEGDRGGERGKSTGQQQLLVLHTDPRWLAGYRSWKSFITGKSSKPSKDGLKKILKLLMTALKTTVKQGRVSEGSSDTRHRFGLGSVAMQPYPEANTAFL